PSSRPSRGRTGAGRASWRATRCLGPAEAWYLIGDVKPIAGRTELARLIALLAALAFALLPLGPSPLLAQTPTKKDAPAKADAKKADDAKKAESKRKEKLDLNSASEADLKTLPGIGEAYVKKNVENRPYQQK